VNADCCQDLRETVCTSDLAPVSCGAPTGKQCPYDNQCLAGMWLFPCVVLFVIELSLFSSVLYFQMPLATTQTSVALQYPMELSVPAPSHCQSNVAAFPVCTYHSVRPVLQVTASLTVVLRSTASARLIMTLSACGDNKCLYSSESCAAAAGWSTGQCCKQPKELGACTSEIDPLVCSTANCRYENPCVAGVYLCCMR